MKQKKKTKYILELDAKEYATFIAAIHILDKENLMKYYGKNLDEKHYNILTVGKTIMQNDIGIIFNEDFIISSELVKKILEGEELK